MKEVSIDVIQSELRNMGVDGWLFSSFRGNDPIAEMLLRKEEGGLATRRWFYFIPSKGEPVKLLHNIEPHSLKDVEGKEIFYSRYDEWMDELSKTLKGVRKICAQYSKDGIIPALSRLDLGLGEFIRSLDVEIVSSQDLVAKFLVTLSQRQFESHLRALKVLEDSITYGFSLVKEAILNKNSINEFSLDEKLLSFLEDNGLITSALPIVAINENAADPHFEPSKENAKKIKEGDLLLIDIWAKEKEADSIYADITWCGYVGKSVPDEIGNIFEIVVKARDKGFEVVKECSKRDVYGYEVDRAVRNYITEKGYGEFFTHRTGHSIYTEDHADGANMDDFETKDTRKIIPNTLFSIEPGIYLKGKIGFRSEINVFVKEKEAIVTGKKQEALIPILK